MDVDDITTQKKLWCVSSAEQKGVANAVASDVFFSLNHLFTSITLRGCHRNIRHLVHHRVKSIGLPVAWVSQNSFCHGFLRSSVNCLHRSVHSYTYVHTSICLCICLEGHMYEYTGCSPMVDMNIYWSLYPFISEETFQRLFMIVHCLKRGYHE